MKRTAKTLLVAAALLAGLAATAVAAPQGVTRYRDTIGSQSANIVTVEMKAGRTGQVVLAGDSVVRDDTTANLIAKQQAAIRNLSIICYQSCGWQVFFKVEILFFQILKRCGQQCKTDITHSIRTGQGIKGLVHALQNQFVQFP